MTSPLIPFPFLTPVLLEAEGAKLLPELAMMYPTLLPEVDAMVALIPLVNGSPFVLRFLQSLCDHVNTFLGTQPAS